MNINYVYSGNCNYTINGTKISLSEGYICILDRNVVRSKEKLSIEDIVINISLSNDFFSRDFIRRLGSASILTKFIFSAITDNNAHDGYIIFRNNSDQAKTYFNELIEEYFTVDSFNRYSIDSLFTLVFIKLIRNYQEQKDDRIIHMNQETNSNLLEIINFIELHVKDCTLEGITTHFNYHPKYLSKLIKNTCQKSF